MVSSQRARSQPRDLSSYSTCRRNVIQSVTFGAIYENVLGANPNNAIRFAGLLLGLAGLTMLWIKEPPIVRDVDEVSYMPSAGH